MGTRKLVVYFFFVFNALWFLYIYSAKKKKINWEKLGSCVSVEVFICMITLCLEKRKFFLEKVGIVLDSFELCTPKSLPSQNVLQ